MTTQKPIDRMTRKEILAVPMYQGGMTHVSCKHEFERKEENRS
jgi:hypothetical protein